MSFCVCLSPVSGTFQLRSQLSCEAVHQAGAELTGCTYTGVAYCLITELFLRSSQPDLQCLRVILCWYKPQATVVLLSNVSPCYLLWTHLSVFLPKFHSNKSPHDLFIFTSENLVYFQVMVNQAPSLSVFQPSALTGHPSSSQLSPGFHQPRKFLETSPAPSVPSLDSLPATSSKPHLDHPLPMFTHQYLPFTISPSLLQWHPSPVPSSRFTSYPILLHLV